MNGKDYCNCEHAQMLLDAVRKARNNLSMGMSPNLVARSLNDAVRKHNAMRKDYNEKIKY